MHIDHGRENGSNVPNRPGLATSSRRLARGFTLVELLVVIGIIALLVSILLPSLNRAREQAKQSKCLSNLRQLQIAWMMYADEHQGIIIPPGTAPGKWVDSGETTTALEDGLLYPYLNNLGVYYCPSDVFVRFRTYSINYYCNGIEGPGTPDAHVRKIAQITHSSEVFVFIEEYDDRGYNIGEFYLNPYPGTVWVDNPAFWHGHGSCLSFADGHCEYYRWSDPRTWNLSGHNTSSPNNVDMLQLQRVLGFSPPP